MERCPYCFKPLQNGLPCDCRFTKESKNAHYSMALPAGTIIGSCCQIGGVLAQGNVYTYLAFDLNQEKKVIVKEFFPYVLALTRSGNYGYLSDRQQDNPNAVIAGTSDMRVYREALDRFCRETEKLEKLGKIPNVVHTSRLIRENNTAYAVTDFVEGKSLEDLALEKGRFSVKETISLLDPIFSALAKLHHQGILHRDISTDNIRICENGELMLVDFGTERIIPDITGPRPIRKRKPFSPPDFLSDRDMDEQSDIYSIGAVFYRMLTGKIPQDPDRRIVQDEMIPPAKLVPAIKPQVSDAVMKALSLNRYNRWRSVEEFRNALNVKADPSEEIYNNAKKLMESGTYAGFEKAGRLFSQIPGWKDADILAEYCLGIADSRNRAAPPNPDLSQKSSASVSAEPSVVRFIPVLILAALLLAAGFFEYKHYTANIEKLYAEQTAFARTREAFYAEQTKAAGAVQPASPLAEPVLLSDTPVPADTPVPDTGPARSERVILLGEFEQDANIANGQEPIEWIMAGDEKDLREYVLISRHVLTNTGMKPDNLKKFIENKLDVPDDKCVREIFFMNSEDVQKYLPDESSRKASFTEYTRRFDKTGEFAAWWLQDAPEKGLAAAFVDGSGKILPYDENAADAGTVFLRPAMRIGYDCLPGSSGE